MVSSIAATGNFEKPLQLTANLLAASSTFRAAIDAANETIAKQSIYIDEADPGTRPRVLIGWDDRSWRKTGHVVYSLTAVVGVLFEYEVSRAAYDASYEDERRKFGNIISGIEGDFLALMRTNTSGLYPDIIAMDGAEIWCPDPDETGDEYVYAARWGIHVKGTG